MTSFVTGLTPYLYVLPLVALLAFVFGYPLVRIFEFSFKMVRGIDGPWIGFRNYELVLVAGSCSGKRSCTICSCCSPSR